MAERNYDDSEFEDIHHALGIQSTNAADLISRHPVLQIVPQGLPVAGTRAPAASAQRSSVEDVLASPTKEGFNALTAPEQKDYMSRVYFGAPQLPFHTLNNHMQNLLGERAGRDAAVSTPDSWSEHYYGSGESPPSLSEGAIAAHLTREPGASIADVAGVPQPSARRASDWRAADRPSDLPPEMETTSGPLGELPKAIRDNIAARIGPHMDEKEFTDKYFGGMYHPDNFTQGSGAVTSSGNSLNFEGRLRDPVSGDNIGSISRTIYSDHAYHGYLSVSPSARGTGAVPSMLSNQIDLYKKMGLQSVRLGANIDVGSYAWAKYGFVPKTQFDWDHLRNKRMKPDWESMKPGLANQPDVIHHVDRILADPDPHAIWDLADVPYKAPLSWQREGTPERTIGKALLMNKSWSGKLDLNGEDSMARFNDYVRSKMK